MWTHQLHRMAPTSRPLPLFVFSFSAWFEWRSCTRWPSSRRRLPVRQSERRPHESAPPKQRPRAGGRTVDRRWTWGRSDVRIGSCAAGKMDDTMEDVRRTVVRETELNRQPERVVESQQMHRRVASRRFTPDDFEIGTGCRRTVAEAHRTTDATSAGGVPPRSSAAELQPNRDTVASRRRRSIKRACDVRPVDSRDGRGPSRRARSQPTRGEIMPADEKARKFIFFHPAQGTEETTPADKLCIFRYVWMYY